jgi:hypothetical protein
MVPAKQVVGPGNYYVRVPAARLQPFVCDDRPTVF